MAIKMLHTCVRVKDLDKALKFYTEGLGLIETSRKDLEQWQCTLVYLSNEVGGYEIELTYNYNTEQPYELGNGFSHTAIGVDDLEGMRERHITLGYEVTDLKGLPGNPPTFYFVTDPDGYKIEIIRNN